MSFRAALGNRGFLALWVAQVVSRLGDAVHEIALVWVVFAVTRDPAVLSLVVVASQLPFLLVSLPAGPLVDRWNRKRVLVAAELVRGAAVLAIPLVGEGPALVPVVVGAALVAGTMEAFFAPARQAIIPGLVDREHLDAANALSQLTVSASQTLYALGGVVVGVVGAFAAFYLDAASFFLSALVLLAIPARAGVPDAGAGRAPTAGGQGDPPAGDAGGVGRPAEAGGTGATGEAGGAGRPAEAGGTGATGGTAAAAGAGRVVADVREGVAFIRGHPLLPALVGISVVANFALAPLGVVIPYYVEAVGAPAAIGPLAAALAAAVPAAGSVDAGSLAFGLAYGAVFVGVFLGSVLVNVLGDLVMTHRGPVVVGALTMTGVSLCAAAVAPLWLAAPVAVGMLALAAAGLFVGAVNVPVNTLVQAVVPDDRRGKVFSAMTVGSTAAAPLGVALAGPALALTGPFAVVFAAGVLVVASGALAATTPLSGVGREAVLDVEPARN